MAGGRPTELTPTMQIQALAYIEGGWQEDSVIPTVEGLALVLDTARRNIYQWGEDNEEFSHTLEKLQGLQAKILQDKGLKGDFNANITKLILSSKHNFAEKSITDITTKGESINEPDPAKAAAYAEYLRNK